MSARHTLLDLRPLRASRDYRRLWAGTSLSGVGLQLTTVAVLFQVWELTGSPLWTGMIGLAHGVPMIAFGLVGGTLADAVDRRTLVRWTTIGQVLSAAALAGQALAGLDSLALVLGLVAVQAGCSALGAPAGRTFVPRLLPRHLVPAGIALQMVAFQAAMLVGPAVGGLVIARWGVAVCYLVNALTFLVSLYGVWRLPSMRPEGEAARPGPRAALDGLRVIGRRPALRGSFVTDLFATVLAMPVALFPVVNEIRFGGDPRTLGLFLTAVAVGGVTAGLFSGAVTRAPRLGSVQLVAAAVWGAALAGFGLTGPVWLALGMLAVAGAADTVSVTTRAALVQLDTPDSHRGRVSSVEHIVGVAGPDLGNVRAGLVAGAIGAPLALVVGGVGCVVGVAAVALTTPSLRRYRVAPGRDPDDDAADDAGLGPTGAALPGPTGETGDSVGTRA